MTDKELGTAAGDIFAKAFTLGYKTGRPYIPAGGVALTAEQVEDVRTVLEYAGGMPHESRIRLRRAALRLVDAVGYPNAYLVQELREALAEVDGEFPATEPAEAAKPRSFEAGDQEPEDRVTIILRGASRGGVAAEFRFGRYATTGLHDNPGAWWRTDQDEPIYAPWDFWLEQFGPLTEVQPAPAEPAEEVKPCGSNSITLGWCKLTARHEGLHTNGTYLWGTPSEPDPPAPAEPAAVRDGSDLVVVQRSHTAKAVQSWMTLDLWTDLGKNDKDFDAEYERQGFGDLWATLLGEVRARIQSTTPAPVEPAEEETKARCLSEIEGWVCSLTTGHDGDHTAYVPDRSAHIWPASSPVVPAPTETGPWKTWQEVPEGRTVRATNGERFRKAGVGAIHLYSDGVGDCCEIFDVGDLQPAPFVAAEEG
ncbi:hypothetical protein [Rhodococcus erythropolis]|uniref:hypothetical protein n=1 Tax=Rhodococcus erythropolis TaxID=1833 RepID=UPI00222651E1|nr:hypothetical protein [Rhodococcus erythropolis]MCW2300617.1 hypothetical protein [Rhodococcus erythropolis]